MTVWCRLVWEAQGRGTAVWRRVVVGGAADLNSAVRHATHSRKRVINQIRFYSLARFWLSQFTVTVHLSLMFECKHLSLRAYQLLLMQFTLLSPNKKTNNVFFCLY